MPRHICIVLLAALYCLVVKSFGDTLVEDRLSRVESQVDRVETKLQEIENSIESINKAVVQLTSSLTRNTVKASGKARRAKRTVINSNPLTDLPDEGDLSELTGPPGKDGKEGPAGPPGPPGKDGVASGTIGTVYTRWGRTTCGSNSKLVYAGYAGGSNFDQIGGGTNFQCMPMNPQYSLHSNNPAKWYGSMMAGVEYQTFGYGIFSRLANQQNVPCARCYATDRSALMMIPAQRNCSEGWNKEYEGYLMASVSNYNHQTTFECVDESPEYVKGESANDNGGVMHFVKTQCDRGGHCPPYDGKKELTCVVCTK